MPVINRIAGFADEMTAWRQHLHQIPELMFECFETSAFVEERLREFGITEIHSGIAKTGIVAIIEGQGAGPTIGLRADMDALPMQDLSGADYASRYEGKSHACGHDGHTTMLLGAAKYLAETRNFSGRVALIFQPAEEGGGGAEVMVKEGILSRFDISQVYALHTDPMKKLGTFFTNPNAILAAADSFDINITGVGGHGAYPEETKDPIPAAVAIAQAFATIVSRNRSGQQDMVVSVTQIHSGTTDNVIPDTAMLNGTVRTFSKDAQQMVKARMEDICAGVARAYDVEVDLTFEYGYPATINDADKAVFACDIAADVVGEDAVNRNGQSDMGAEDFSYMLNERPGCYLYIGQGDGPGLHNPAFNFNDEIAPLGASFFARLVESAQPLKGT